MVIKEGNEQRQEPSGKPRQFYGQDRAQRYSRYDYCRHLDGNVCLFFRGVSPEPRGTPLLFSLSPDFALPVPGGRVYRRCVVLESSSLWFETPSGIGRAQLKGSGAL